MTNNTDLRPDPTALGLFGLAIVTLVASSEKLAITSGYSYVVPWAIFLGAIAQLIAGILDFQKNNIFGGVAFCGYGLFWLGTSTSWMFGMGAFGPELAVHDPRQLGFAFLGYLIFTIYMTLGSMEVNKNLFIIFVLIDLLFIGLVMASFGFMPEFGQKLAGLSELGIAIFSFYGSAANVLANHFGREFLPVGKPFGIFK